MYTLLCLGNVIKGKGWQNSLKSEIGDAPTIRWQRALELEKRLWTSREGKFEPKNGKIKANPEHVDKYKEVFGYNKAIFQAIIETRMWS